MMNATPLHKRMIEAGDCLSSHYVATFSIPSDKRDATFVAQRRTDMQSAGLRGTRVGPLLTPPGSNRKLANASDVEYGLFLAPDKLGTCPWSTAACRSVCVADKVGTGGTPTAHPSAELPGVIIMLTPKGSARRSRLNHPCAATWLSDAKAAHEARNERAVAIRA